MRKLVAVLAVAVLLALASAAAASDFARLIPSANVSPSTNMSPSAAPITTSAPPGGPLSDQAETQLVAMPVGTTVVPCSPQLAKVPAGLTTSHMPAIAAVRPGFQVLIDGHCVVNTTLPVQTLVPAPVEGP